jgi:hypothetical protein
VILDALPGLVLLLLGMLCVLKDLREEPGRVVPDDWTTTEGTVVSAEAIPSGEAAGPSGAGWPVYKAVVTYEFVGGSARRQAVFDRFEEAARGDLDAVERVVAAFPKSTVVRVAYDPDDPTLSVLESKPRSRAIFALGLALLVGGALHLGTR